MSNSKLIEGKVAQLLNERELVINLGSNHGVKRGMKFSVMATNAPVVVRDPDTGDILGNVDREKIRVEAIVVYELMTICRTRSIANPLDIVQRLYLPPTRDHESLRADKSFYPAPISEEDSYVKPGDKVVQVYETKAEDQVIGNGGF